MKKIFLFFLLFFSVLLSPSGLASAAAEVTDLRWTARNDGNPPFVRVVMDLSKKVKAVASLDDSGKKLEIVLKDTKKSGSISQDYAINTQNVKSAAAANDGDSFRLDIALATPMKMDDISLFALKPDEKADRPHRLVIDISSVSTSEKSKNPSAATATADKNAKKALKGKIICLDPGHGGSDVGAIGQLGQKTVYEKDITLSIAEPLRDMLKAAGAKVIMTREMDKDVAGAYAEDKKELQARCDIANKAKADVFVSIHIDSFSNSSVDGTTAYYYPKKGNDLLLAQMLHQSTLTHLAIPDRGVRSNDLYVNVHATMPSVLMEMGFISNTHRLQMLTSSWGAKRIAETLYDGLVDYFTQAG